MMLTTLVATVLLSGTPTYSVDRVAYDGHSLIVDGKPTFVFSGAFHYFRCPKELWTYRFQAIKAAGMNAVETYVPWNWHEQSKPSSVRDNSKLDLKDLKDWLKMAHAYKLNTIIRPGPYICAEWAGGGYPRWLVRQKPEGVAHGTWLRGDEASYLAWSKHWYDAVCKVVAPEQISRKKPGNSGVILFQIENEYDFWGGANAEQRKNQLKALYDYARAGGIDVPIIGCWTRELRDKSVPGMTGVFDSPNLYSKHDIRGAGAQIDSVKKAQPDAPGMVTELQGGWFSGVGGQLSEDQAGIDPLQIRAITLECIARGATVLNYYMFFGGTHFGDWGSRGMTTSYDYYAPIREWGATGAKYEEVRAIGLMLVKYGEEIATSDRVDRQVEGAGPFVHVIVRRSSTGKRFVFIRNSSESAPSTGVCKVTLDDGSVMEVGHNLPPFGTDVVMVPEGEKESWKGLRICVAKPVAERPEVPAPIRVEEAWTKLDDGGAKWKKRAPGAALVDVLERETGLSVYREVVRLDAAALAKSDQLAVELFSDDTCLLKVNGKPIGKEQTGRRVSFDVRSALKEGDNEFVLLHEDRGHPNWGAGMEDPNGVVRAFLTDVAAGLPITEWRVKSLPPDGGTSYLAENVDDSDWGRMVLNADTVAALEGLGQPGALGPQWPADATLYGRGDSAIYRAKFELTRDQIDAGLTTLVFDRIDDVGIVYVNGQEAGKHSQWDVPYEVDVKALLKPGVNTVAVVVTNTDGGGGLTKPVRLARGVSGGVPVPFSQISRLKGAQDGWWKENASKSGWSPVSLDVATPIARKGGEMPKSDSQAFAVWTRTEFTLPQKSRDTWVPWRALVRASGNGEMFLNGHSIGRYWEVGPQREFFLPECWLNFGKKNVLTFCLRSTDNGEKVDAVEVSPYPDSAEVRK